MTTKVRVEDHGFRRAKRLLEQRRKVLVLGVFDEWAAVPHHDSGGDETVGEIAVKMEYGEGSGKGAIPARSWLFDWVDENLQRIYKDLTQDTMRLIFGHAGRGPRKKRRVYEDEAKALGRRGTVYRRAIISRIKRRIPPPNARRTLKRKMQRGQGTTPLIASGQFLNSIRWKVR